MPRCPTTLFVILGLDPRIHAGRLEPPERRYLLRSMIQIVGSICGLTVAKALKSLIRKENPRLIHPPPFHPPHNLSHRPHREHGS
jgi:hypothetical protein